MGKWTKTKNNLIKNGLLMISCFYTVSLLAFEYETAKIGADFNKYDQKHDFANPQPTNRRFRLYTLTCSDRVGYTLEPSYNNSNLFHQSASSDSTLPGTPFGYWLKDDLWMNNATDYVAINARWNTAVYIDLPFALQITGDIKRAQDSDEFFNYSGSRAVWFARSLDSSNLPTLEKKMNMTGVAFTSTTPSKKTFEKRINTLKQHPIALPELYDPNQVLFRLEGGYSAPHGNIYWLTTFRRGENSRGERVTLISKISPAQSSVRQAYIELRLGYEPADFFDICDSSDTGCSEPYASVFFNKIK
ncbi:hypothetical protein [Endozoicomonas numazuensis]|uniref:Uncharacterized protein n=1 Tax=Endozoicomonas numazuensis TaxID=1137799 RepID=A0A081NJY6_9GAMM|nr:hypothetical protein [Endozoicomonas numazuensis]KEQ18759.1 hypothetical protein GZ78_01300 [Endozoicomonas numazuensis]